MKLGYVLLYVDDVRKSLAFYKAAFGIDCRFVHESGAYAELDTGQTTLAFVSHSIASSHGFAYQRADPSKDAPGFEIAFVSDDVSSAYAVAVAAGATAISEPAEKPWGQTVAYVRDLNGYLVELCSPVSP